jgi:hypothetical protein
MATKKNCTICVRRGLVAVDGSSIFLCIKCADPFEVRTYCAKCKVRLRMTVQEAKVLFEKTGTGIVLKQAGVAMLYQRGCPSCTEDAPLPIIYHIENPEVITRAIG